MSGRPELSKVSRPHVPEVVKRNRLFRLIDKGRGSPICWISGPGGSGKTILAASYIEARSLPSIWYRLDQGDADIATFFYYLSLAAKKAAPRKKRPLPLLTPEYLGGIPVFSRRFFEDLCSRLTSSRSSSLPKKGMGGVIVLDNYQDVPPESEFHDVLLNGLKAVPYGMTVFILSREDPPVQFSEMGANNELFFIGWEEIRLTLDETVELVELRRAGLPKKLMRVLHEKIGGWTAGLLLALERIGQGAALPETFEQCAKEATFGYFAEEIFRRAEPGMQDFLLRTALLPVITTPMAKGLTGNDHSGRILSRLYHGNYFTERRSGTEFTYQYHPLLREFLLSVAEVSFAPEELLSLRKKAAGLLEGAGMIEAAAGLFQEASEWEGLLSLVFAHAQQMITQGRNKTLENWLSAVPESVRDNNAWLLYWLGICRLHFKPAESQDIIERAFDLFKTQDDLTGMALSCASIVEAHHLLWHDFSGLSRWIAEMTDILKRGKGGFPPQIEALLTISMFAAVMHHDPGHPDMPRLVKETRQLMKQVPDTAQRLMIASLLEIYYSWLGETEEVKLIFEELRPEVKSPAALPAAVIFFGCMEAVFLWNIGVFGASVDTALEGLALAYATGIHVFDARLIAQGIFSTLMSGDLEKAAELLEQLAESTDFSKKLQAAHYNYLSAGYSLCRGELTQALSQAEKTVASIVKSGFPFAQMISFQMIALVLFDKGEPDRAFPFLEKARELAGRIKSKPAEYVNSLSEAYFFLAKAGAKEKGLEALRCAFSLGRQHDIVNYYGMRRSMIIFLCLKALEEGLEVEYTQNLIRRCKLLPETPPLELEDWPWPLKIYTLGRFKIIKEGRRVYFPGKVQQKPLELLKALIAFGGSGVSAEKIIEALWPETEGDAAFQSFETTVHRLRKLLGIEKAVVRKESRISLAPWFCWVDAIAFERTIEKTEEHLFEKAVGLYRGNFLENEKDRPWLITVRERLKSKFLRAVLKLGQGLEQKGQWTEAVECYQKALETEELAEELYYRLMTCCHKAGNRAEAVSVYRRCRAVLSKVLHVGPSARTEELYNLIMSGNR